MLVKVTDVEYGTVSDRVFEEFIEYHGGIDSLIGCTSGSIFDEYCRYCKEINKYPMGKTAIMRKICSKYGCMTKLFTVEGKKTRVLLKKI